MKGENRGSKYHRTVTLEQVTKIFLDCKAHDAASPWLDFESALSRRCCSVGLDALNDNEISHVARSCNLDIKDVPLWWRLKSVR